MFCPDCIEEMVIEIRKPYKFGKHKFYVCPKCGYNIAVKSQRIYDKIDSDIWKQNIKELQNINH